MPSLCFGAAELQSTSISWKMVFYLCLELSVYSCCPGMPSDCVALEPEGLAFLGPMRLQKLENVLGRLPPIRTV